jgi:putative ABC transport system permease protein
MYIIENALLNLAKNKGRNILLGVIICAIITATVVALSIFNTTGTLIADTKAALQSAVRVAPQKVMTGGNAEPAVSFEQYEAFGESAYLDGAEVKRGSGADGVEAVYYLKQPELLADFEAELRRKGLPATYSVRTDETLLEKTAGSVESLQGLSLTFLIIVIVLGAAIMVLLSMLSIRERKYEIGVLRAMGMKKNTVALGLWTEIIAMTCLCFVIGMGAGTLLSQPVSDALMSGQTPLASASGSTLADRLGAAAETAGQIDQVSISVDAVTALEIFAISLLLASIAGIISVSRITKYEPIKILMERN